jgi:hypothetical protein
MTGLHWITVGHISKKALKTIKIAGGRVVRVQAVADVPAIFMIGIPCQVLSRNTDDVEIRGWNEMSIKVPSHGLAFTLSSKLYKERLHINQVPVDKCSSRSHCQFLDQTYESL